MIDKQALYEYLVERCDPDAKPHAESLYAEMIHALESGGGKKPVESDGGKKPVEEEGSPTAEDA